MKTRMSAMVCLLCVLSATDLTRAADPYSQRVADPYAVSDGLPTMTSGTFEPYLSVMAGIALPFDQDATFTGEGPGSGLPTVVKDIDYQTKHSVGGNAGIWFPTRNKLAGFDLGVEITGFIWYPDVVCCIDNYNRDPSTGSGTTTEIQGIYVGTNFLIRYPLAISESYPNGRWFPYVGVGVGAHQMAMRPGGMGGTGFFNAITEQRHTAVAFQGVGGLKVHLFKYVAAFVEAKYIRADHSRLTTDRTGQSLAYDQFDFVQGLAFHNPYQSTIDTIFIHAGMSIHFDWKP